MFVTSPPFTQTLMRAHTFPDLEIILSLWTLSSGFSASHLGSTGVTAGLMRWHPRSCMYCFILVSEHLAESNFLFFLVLKSAVHSNHLHFNNFLNGYDTYLLSVVSFRDFSH